ncbi:hypothetical protein HUU61_05680 [Rhodopseudomonas palustris]|nr:hypothetical protein [Rhodopseudomonas palustris]
MTSSSIDILCCGAQYRFLAFEWNHSGDGSLYIMFVRGGETLNSTYDANAGTWLCEKATPRGFRISYHGSGVVRYHGIDGRTLYFPPLSELDNSHSIVSVSIPGTHSLDSRLSGKADHLLECPAGERLSIAISAGPVGAIQADLAINFPYFSVSISRFAELPIELVVGKPDHVHILTPRVGPFDKQIMSKGSAYIRHHQTVVGSEEMIIYRPNAEGVYRVIFASEMRIPPNVSIVLADPTTRVVDLVRTDHFLKFKVRDSTGKFVRGDIGILSIVLDARL